MRPRDFGSLVRQRLATMTTIKQAGGLAGAGKTLGGVLGTAAKGYRTATTPLAVHATKALPAAAQPVAKNIARGASAAATAGTAYHAYDQAATATSDAAQNVARQAGVRDQSVLDEVGSRARSQMIPMAYRAVAPAWAGGDNTPIGQQVRQDIGTIAKHNISPALLNPSQTAVNWTPAERTYHAALGNPVGAVSSAIFPARPSAQQMWNNVPAQQRVDMAQNMFTAAQSPGNSPLARGMQHVFEPAIQDRSRYFHKAVADAGNYIQNTVDSFTQ